MKFIVKQYPLYLGRSETGTRVLVADVGQATTYDTREEASEAGYDYCRPHGVFRVIRTEDDGTPIDPP